MLLFKQGDILVDDPIYVLNTLHEKYGKQFVIAVECWLNVIKGENTT